MWPGDLPSAEDRLALFSLCPCLVLFRFLFCFVLFVALGKCSVTNPVFA